MDFAGACGEPTCVAPTVTCNVLYAFFVLSLDRRRVLHLNVTAHPYGAWAGRT
jgi:hypothetical protein